MQNKGTLEQLLRAAAKNVGLGQETRQAFGTPIQQATEVTGLSHGISALAGTFHIMMQGLSKSAGSVLSVLPNIPKVKGSYTGQHRPTA